ncbi:AraC-type DNA-binding protein [Cohaesibacter sp. ES.047]|uniref:AraC family transcriptional regulator n=1 Tax=Cohaesibacter sp. ES.047 TaxID=1798205 RepID=UPI000BB686B0|nr:AraC family transcriptional regulator [Cohaesibacter sp. ES.047]SNY90244.1 AraC-type DNA-binding protein [Cohaesibacter sp. ES.047]
MGGELAMFRKAPTQTRIISSHYAVHEGWQGLFAYQFLRAGHICTGPDFKVERAGVPGHEFLFCLIGRGTVTVDGRKHVVGPKELVWLPVYERHAHLPDREDPWELLWLRVDSANLARLAAILSVHEDPVFHFDNPRRIQQVFEGILSQLEVASLAAQASCDRHISGLVEYLLEARGSRLIQPEAANHKGFGHLMTQIHIHYNDHWDIDKLAKACRVSKSHLFRLFRKAFDKTPLNWLRDYRIAQAKRFLVETDDSISMIAMKVGYDDPFYFSRDFKKQTGLAPRAFRLKVNSCDGF